MSPTNGSVPDGCVAAHIALERADHANEKADDALSGFRSTYDALGSLQRAVEGMRAEMREGFRQMGARLGRTEHEVEELEDTGIRDLRAQIAKAHDEAGKWRWALIGLAATVIAGVITAIIAAKMGVH